MVRIIDYFQQYTNNDIARRVTGMYCVCGDLGGPQAIAQIQEWRAEGTISITVLDPVHKRPFRAEVNREQLQLFDISSQYIMLDKTPFLFSLPPRREIKHGVHDHSVLLHPDGERHALHSFAAQNRYKAVEQVVNGAATVPLRQALREGGIVSKTLCVYKGGLYSAGAKIGTVQVQNNQVLIDGEENILRCVLGTRIRRVA